MENKLPLTLEKLRAQYENGCIPIGTYYHVTNGWVAQYGPNSNVLYKNDVTIRLLDHSPRTFEHQYIYQVMGVNSAEEASQAFLDYSGVRYHFTLTNDVYQYSYWCDSSGD